MRTLIEHGRRAGGAYAVSKVLSDNSGAGGLGIARSLGVPTEVIAAGDTAGAQGFERVLARAIHDSSPSLVVLAGFMRILSAAFVQEFAGKIMNIHPSLLPKYPGLHTHRRALEAHEAEHGATVHFVTERLDGGPRIIQARVDVRPAEDETGLAARVQAEEHRIYPIAVSWFCEGRLRYADGGALLDQRPLLEPIQYTGVQS